MVASGARVPQPLSIFCQPPGTSETHVCALPARGLGSLFYGSLIRTWQKGSRGSTQPCGEWPEDPHRKDSWTIKRVLCLPGCPSPSHGDKSQPEEEDKRYRIAGSRLMRRNMQRGTIPLDSCRAGLVTSQGLLRPVPHRPSPDPKG